MKKGNLKKTFFKCTVTLALAAALVPVAFELVALGAGVTGAVVTSDFGEFVGNVGEFVGNVARDFYVVKFGVVQNFAFDSAAIPDGANGFGFLSSVADVFDWNAYEWAAEWLQRNENVMFSTIGCTDEIGTASHNMTLSGARADAVTDKLIGLGVNAEQITSTGIGEACHVNGSGVNESVRGADSRAIAITLSGTTNDYSGYFWPLLGGIAAAIAAVSRVTGCHKGRCDVRKREVEPLRSQCATLEGELQRECDSHAATRQAAGIVEPDPADVHRFQI